MFIILPFWATATSCHSTTKEATKTEILKDGDILNLVIKNDIPGVTKALKTGAILTPVW